MDILGIETSCDDTGVAVVRFNNRKPFFVVLSNIIASQVEIHKQWGGVYPTLAKREHQKNLVSVLENALKKAKKLVLFKNKKNIADIGKEKKIKNILSRETDLRKSLIDFLKKYKKPRIDAIAVTVGPGLEPCLWTGVNFARALSFYWQIPLVPVNHIEGHIFANFLSKDFPADFRKIFPAIGLVVSGGHTQLILIKDIGKYRVLGETRDDAAGECFDKVARILGLGYPGGPIIAAKAGKFAKNFASELRLPRPMLNQGNYDFSFSGLKTAVLYNYNRQSKEKRKSKLYVKEMCFEVQQAIAEVLVKKTIKAARDYLVKSIIVGGGVAANKELRKKLRRSVKKEISGVALYAPDNKFCTDNAAMIAVAAYFNFRRGEIKDWKKIRAKANLKL